MTVVTERHIGVNEFVQQCILDIKPNTTLLHTFDYWRRTTPDAVCCLFPIPPKCEEYEEMTFERLWTLTDKLYGKVAHRVPQKVTNKQRFASLMDQQEKGTCRPVIGLLSDNNPFTMLMVVALMRCDVTVLMLSPRNSMAGLESLCRETGAECIMTTSKWVSKFAKSSELKLVNYNEYTLEEIDEFPPSGITLRDPHPQELCDTIFIYHSSGSTRHPSPIPETNLGCLMTASWGDEVRDDRERSLNISPIFHAFGLFSILAPTLAGTSIPAMPLAVSSPPKVAQILRSMKKGKITRFATVPILFESILDYLEDRPEEWECIRPVYCSYAGAALPTKVAAAFNAHGVAIISAYGSTEIGIGMLGPQHCIENQGLEDRWKILKPHKFLSYKMVPQHDCPDIYELIVLSDSPCFLESVRNCPDGYATKDLFSPGPVENSWIFHGRRDDTIVHVNGEKTNALAMENAIQKASNLIQRAAVVGSGQPQTGALVELNPTHNFDGDQFEEVKRAIQIANAEAPNHSHIMDEMIYILPKGQTLPVTQKGNVKRSLLTKLYNAEIERLFTPVTSIPNIVLPSGSGGTKPPGVVPGASPSTKYHMEQAIKHQLLDRVATVLEIPLEDLEAESHVNLFDLGLTSQMAVSLNRSFMALSGRELSANHLFEHSSIDALVASLMPEDQAVATVIDKIAESHKSMQQLVMTYRQILTDISSIVPIECLKAPTYSPDMKDKVIMITGATGALGCHLVSQILKDPSVKKIYALVRGQDVADRLIQTAIRRGLNFCDGIESKRLEVLTFDMTDPKFGLSDFEYTKVSAEVTHVIHNAWKMNFNLKVEDFNKDCIRSTFNLLKFCVTPLTTGSNYYKKELSFVSSVSSVCGYTGPSIPAKIFSDDQIQMAMPMGYGQSKCVSELIIDAASRLLGLKTRVFRCGQLSGDTKLGVWTPTDLIALLTIAGGVKLKMIPSMVSDASFAPMDVAAAGITELMSAPQPEASCQVYHISNPNPSEWDDWTRSLTEKGVNFEIVKTSEFLKEVKHHPDNECNLLASFLEKLPDCPAGLKAPKLAMDEAVEHSPSLRNCPPLSGDLTSKYLDYWRSIGLMH